MLKLKIMQILATKGYCRKLRKLKERLCLEIQSAKKLKGLTQESSSLFESFQSIDKLKQIFNSMFQINQQTKYQNVINLYQEALSLGTSGKTGRYSREKRAIFRAT